MRRVLVAVPLLAAAACGGRGGPAAPAAAPTPPTPPAAANAVVEYVVDGDTIDVTMSDGGAEERVRLIGIDTPEIAHAASGGRVASEAECFGDEARRFAESLLPPGTAVRLERDVVPRDDYGRLLAYVYRADDGVLVNYELARQGYAQPLTIPPNVTFSERIVEAVRAAERDDAGLWSACAG